MEWLKEILEKEGQTQEQILEAVNAEFPKHAVPKEQYNKKVEALGSATTELETAQTQLSETNGKIEKLTLEVGDNEALKTSMTSLQGEYEEYKTGEGTRLTDIQKRHKAEILMGDGKANKDSIDLLVGQLDFSTMNLLESGVLDGFDSQFEGLKEARPTLFATTETVDPNGEPVGGGAITPDDNLRAHFGL